MKFQETEGEMKKSKEKLKPEKHETEGEQTTMRTTSADEVNDTKNQTMIMTTCIRRSRDKGIRFEKSERLNDEDAQISRVQMFCDE
eukprot:11972758-Karenia_brevis.AAC.1